MTAGIEEDRGSAGAAGRDQRAVRFGFAGQLEKSVLPVMFDTVASAAGCRKANGDLVDDFGDPTAPGLITEIIA